MTRSMELMICMMWFVAGVVIALSIWFDRSIWFTVWSFIAAIGGTTTIAERSKYEE